MDENQNTGGGAPTDDQGGSQTPPAADQPQGMPTETPAAGQTCVTCGKAASGGTCVACGQGEVSCSCQPASGGTGGSPAGSETPQGAPAV